MPPDCLCGQPATEYVDTGAIHTDRGWRRCVEAMCGRCARMAEYEREEGRRG